MIPTYTGFAIAARGASEGNCRLNIKQEDKQ